MDRQSESVQATICSLQRLHLTLHGLTSALLQQRVYRCPLYPNMLKLTIILLLLVSGCFGATLQSLQSGSSAATGTLNNFPLGSWQWAMRFHALPTTTTGSNRILAQINTLTSGGSNIRIFIPANTLTIVIVQDLTGEPVGIPTIPLNGRTDVRMVVTHQKDATYGQTRVDTWAGDCTGYVWSNLPSPDQGTEPSTTSLGFQMGGNNIAVDFFRASGYPVAGIGAPPVCPADVLTTPAPNMDFRFEGSSLTDVSGNGYVLTASGATFPASTTYNPVVIIAGSWTAPRPVVPEASFTLNCNVVLSDGNVSAATYTWSRQSGATGSFSVTNTATTTFTPTSDGDLKSRCVAVDANSNSGQLDFDVGIVSSDANGIKIQTNAALGWVEGLIPRFGVEPWPWFPITEALDAETLIPYFQAGPQPATICAGTCAIGGVYFSGRGPFTGALTDTYDVKVTSGSPDSYQWRKNGGSYSSAIPISQSFCYGNPITLPVTDGVIICFESTTGHTTGDVYSREAPFAGTASITGTGNNKLDPSNGQVVSNGSSGCAASNWITAIGTGTHWSTGTVTQKLTVGNQYWLEWDYANDGSNQGRFPQIIQAINSDTEICVSGNGNNWPIPVSQSAMMTIQDSGTPGGSPPSFDYGLLYSVSSSAGSNLNFYDVVLGLVRLAQATNYQPYIDGAQGACNTWWQYGLDHGYRSAAPRNAGYQGMMACMELFGYSWIGAPITSSPGSGLSYQITYITNAALLNPTSGVTRDGGVWDDREAAMLTRATALMAHIDHSGTPWCTYLTNQANNIWLYPAASGGVYTLTNSNQDAYWQFNSLWSNIGYPAGGTPGGPYQTAVSGASPWRGMGLGAIGATEMYRSLANASDCNNSSLATTIQTLTEKATAWIWDYGRDNAGGLYYNAGYATKQGLFPSDAIFNLPNENSNRGAANITVSGTAVTAPSGTGNFTRQFAPCNGTSRIVINGGAAIAVNSCASDDALALASSGGTLSTTTWYNDSTIQVTNGSATIVGTRTGFLNLFAPCDGTTSIAIEGATATDNAIYQVTACADNTHLTINVNYAGTTQSAVTEYALTKQAQQVCTPSIGTCDPNNPSDQGVNLANDWGVSLGQRYQWTGNPTYKTQLEYALGSMMGGNASGPQFLGPNYGPQSTYAPTYFDQPLTGCNVTATLQPCTLGSGKGDGNGMTTGYGQWGKSFGQLAGAGDGRNAIAFYLIPAGASTGGLTTSGGVHYSGGVATH